MNGIIQFVHEIGPEPAHPPEFLVAPRDPFVVGPPRHLVEEPLEAEHRGASRCVPDRCARRRWALAR